MNRFVQGFLVGAAVTGVLVSVSVLARAHNLSRAGRISGRLLGLTEAAQALQDEFGELDGRPPCTVVFRIKTTDVVSIETNGIKTVRVIP